MSDKCNGPQCKCSRPKGMSREEAVLRARSAYALCYKSGTTTHTQCMTGLYDDTAALKNIVNALMAAHLPAPNPDEAWLAAANAYRKEFGMAPLSKCNERDFIQASIRAVKAAVAVALKEEF